MKLKEHKRPYFTEKKFYNLQKLWGIIEKLNTLLET